MNLPKGYLSPAQVNTWRDCPRCYEYAYIKKIPRPASIHYAIGSFAHRAVEIVAKRIIEERDVNLEEAMTLGAQAFDHKLEEPLDEDGVELALVDLAKFNELGEAKDEAARITHCALQSFPKLLRDRRVIACESDLSDLPEEILALAFPFPVKGRIDLLYGDKTEMAVDAMTDLKTSSKRGGPDENGVLQFSFYGLPAHMAGAEWRIGADIQVKTRTPELLTYWANGTGYLTPANYRAAHEIILDVAEHISRGDFPVGKGWNGKHDYEHGLASFSLAVSGFGEVASHEQDHRPVPPP